MLFVTSPTRVLFCACENELAVLNIWSILKTYVILFCETTERYPTLLFQSFTKAHPYNLWTVSVYYYVTFKKQTYETGSLRCGANKFKKITSKYKYYKKFEIVQKSCLFPSFFFWRNFIMKLQCYKVAS